MSRQLPERPSLEHLRKQAKDLLRASKPGDPTMTLADAQFRLAREYGFDSWPKLVHYVESLPRAGSGLRPLIRPIEMPPGGPWRLGDGATVPNDDVYAMFVAAREGDFATVKRLVERAPALATVEYNYTPPIHFSAREGHRDITAYLLDRGANPGYRSYPFAESLLGFAEERGHADVAALLRERLERNFVVASGTQAIIAAAAEGNVKAVRAELARDPRLARAGNETGDTALHHAAKHGHVDVVRLLLDAGADADAVRGDGYRPIHCAMMPNWFSHSRSRRGAREEIAHMLFAKGARDTIFIAAMRGDLSFVRGALSSDRSLANFEDTCHHRPLSAAVRRGDVEMARLLLQHGADPNLPEEGAPRGASLLIAVADRQRELVTMLLAAGADPNADVDSSGTPVLRADGDERLLAELRAHGGRVEPREHELIAELVEKGKTKEAERMIRANPDLLRRINEEAGWGDGIMAGPANNGDHKVLDMLLRLGARVPTVSKWAPEYYFKHERTARFLLERGMDPNHMNWHRFTLVHHMAAEGALGKLRLLLGHGADIDPIDDEYRSTPLGVAARRGQLAAVKMLLELGADPTLAGAPWATPLAWAESKGHEHVAAALRAFMRT